jgi:hypothetical protein
MANSKSKVTILGGVGGGEKPAAEPALDLDQWDELTLEQKRRVFDEQLRTGYYIHPAKTVTPVLTAPVSPKLAAAVAANPESLRVSARGDDGVAVLGGAQSNSQRVTVRVDWVSAVDAEGRPIWDRPGVVADYDPPDALQRE